MKRLTFEGNFCDIALCLERPGGEHCGDGACSQRKVWERLKEYEDREEQGRLVERERGEWIEDGYYGNPFVCSNCGCEGCYYGDGHNKQYYYTKFCPACGADMRPEGGAENA